MSFAKAAMIDRRRLVAASAAAALTPLLPGAGGGAAAAQPSIFDSTERRREGLKPFPKWSGALEKYFEERKDTPGTCADLTFNRCHYAEWYAELERLRGQHAEAQIKQINRFMNERRYIIDPINWGVQDYWAAPGEFFRRNGDCEDYAIAKFLSLRALETAVEDMRLFIVDDLNLRVGHAITAVYLNGTALILDNQLSIVVEARRIRHYRPIYSVNEDGWWKHRVGR